MARPLRLGLFTQAYRRWKEDRAPRLAAALAYYSVFSLAPMLLLAAALGSLAFGDMNLQAKLVQQMSGLIGKQGAEALGGMMRSNPLSTSSGIVGALIGFGGLVLASVGLLEQLRDALNSVWDVKAPEHQSIGQWLRRYLANGGLVVAAGFLLLVSLVVTSVVSSLTERVHHAFAGSAALWFGIDVVAGLTAAVIVFTLVYRVIPDTKVGWGEALSGGIFTAVLFTIGRLALGIYLGRKAGDSVTDAAGSVLALLVWVYYSAQLVLFGAEFTVVYAGRRDQSVAQRSDQDRRANLPGPRPIRSNPG